MVFVFLSFTSGLEPVTWASTYDLAEGYSLGPGMKIEVSGSSPTQSYYHALEGESFWRLQNAGQPQALLTITMSQFTLTSNLTWY